MAEVKFIQIGANQELIWDDSVTPAASSYNAVRNEAIHNYPGSVIFGQYKKSAGATKVYYELWANGKEYKIGGGEDLTLFSGSDDPWTYFTTGHDGASETPAVGTYYIKIVGSARTAYILTNDSYTLESSWAALSGNVNAENVFFPNGFERTEAWGTAASSTLPVTDTDIVGHNLKDVFEYYLVKETWPSVGTATDNSTAPSFTAQDAGTTLVVKYTDTDGDDISNGDNVLYNSVVYIKNTYKPTLTATATPSETLVFGPNKIIDMYSKGWSTTVSGGTITASDTRSGSTISATRGIVTTNNSGTNKTAIKINSTQVGEVSESGGNNVAIEHTINNETTLGTKTISVVNTNGNSITTTYTSGGSSVTSVSIPAIGDTYYLSNKGNRQSDKKISKAAVTVNLPTTASKTVSSTELSYKVYLPVYVSKTGTQSEKKYYGSAMFVYNSSNGDTLGVQFPGDATTRANWYVKFPASTSIQTFTVNNESVSAYTISDISETINGATVSYKKLQFTDSAAYAPDATITLKLN